MSIVRCISWLCVAFCLLLVVCSLSFGVCCVAGCLLLVVCCSVFGALFVVCGALFIVVRLLICVYGCLL